MNSFEPAVYDAVRTYSLRADLKPNQVLTDMYQANIDKFNYDRIYKNTPNFRQN